MNRYAHEYGEQGFDDDPASRAERQIADEALRAASWDVSELVNRPVGSHAVSLPDQLDDYLTQVWGNSEAAGAIYDNLAKADGPFAGLGGYLKYIHRMEALRSKQYREQLGGETE